jgi:hypothetical protein
LKIKLRGINNIHVLPQFNEGEQFGRLPL